MKFKVWLPSENKMATELIALRGDGMLEIPTYDPQKRAAKQYGYFLQQLPMLAAPWAANDMHVLDKINIYVGDIVTDDSGYGPFVVVPTSYGGFVFIHTDTPDGTHIIGCPWDNMCDNVTIQGNMFENGDIITNQTLAKQAHQRLDLVRLTIK